MKPFILLCLLAVTACGKQGSGKLYPVKSEALSKFVNAKNMPASPNLSIDKTIINTSYPIEIVLYQDGRFYYDLPNLGDGHGTWVHKSDHLELKAKRSLFDMYIEVYGTDEEVQTLSIQFSDRFGPNTLKMDNKNI